MTIDRHEAYGLTARLIREFLEQGHASEGLATELKRIERALRDAWEATAVVLPATEPEKLVEETLTQGCDADDYNGRPRC